VSSSRCASRSVSAGARSRWSGVVGTPGVPGGNGRPRPSRGRALRGRPPSSRSRRTRVGSARWPSDPDDVVTPSFFPVCRDDTESVHPQPSAGC
jgi:hypothetical protein